MSRRRNQYNIDSAQRSVVNEQNEHLILLPEFNEHFGMRNLFDFFFASFTVTVDRE